MNQDDYEKISNISQPYEDDNITTSDIDNTKSLGRFHNQIKYQLLSGASRRNGTLVDFSCGKAADLHRWYRCKYNKILVLMMIKLILKVQNQMKVVQNQD